MGQIGKGTRRVEEIPVIRKYNGVEIPPHIVARQLRLNFLLWLKDRQKNEQEIYTPESVELQPL